MRFTARFNILSRSALLAASSCTALLGAPAIAMAQDQQASNLDDVIVTGSRRDSSIQDVPFSINAQTQEDIQRSGAVMRWTNVRLSVLRRCPLLALLAR